MSDTAKPNIETSAPEVLKTIPPRKERVPLAKTLPTDRITLDKQVETIRAYAAVFASNGGQPVTNDQAGEIVGLSGSTISQTNGFFNDIGLLSRGEEGGFIPSAEVIEYNNACQWDLGEAKLKLRPIFERTWFYRCLVPRLQLAPQSHAICLALLANESKAQDEHKDRLMNLMGFLEAAGIVSMAGGNVTLLKQGAAAHHKPEGVKPPVPPPVPPPEIDPDQHILYLDGQRQRKVKLTAPLTISNAEYTRICNWIKVALIIEDGEKKNLPVA